MPVFFQLPTDLYGSSPENISAQEMAIMDRDRLAQAQNLAGLQADRSNENDQNRTMLMAASAMAQEREKQRQEQAMYALGLARLQAAQAAQLSTKPIDEAKLHLAQQTQQENWQKDVVKSLEASVADATSPIDVQQFTQLYSGKVRPEFLSSLQNMIVRKNQMLANEKMQAASMVNVLNMPTQLQQSIAIMQNQADALPIGSPERNQMAAKIAAANAQLKDAQARLKMVDPKALANAGIVFNDAGLATLGNPFTAAGRGVPKPASPWPDNFQSLDVRSRQKVAINRGLDQFIQENGRNPTQEEAMAIATKIMSVVR